MPAKKKKQRITLVLLNDSGNIEEGEYSGTNLKEILQGIKEDAENCAFDNGTYTILKYVGIGKLNITNVADPPRYADIMVFKS